MKRFNLGHSKPLTYPMTQEQLDNLGETMLVSPRVGNSHGYERVSDELYKEQVKELPVIRKMVESGKFPTEYLKIYTGSGEVSDVLTSTLGHGLKDPRKASDTVKMDHPFDIWDLVIEPWAKANNIPKRNQPTHQGVPFVEGVLDRAFAHSLIAKALNRAFDVKNAFGTCRPEEYFDSSITRYKTPNHPEEPAGHGAFAGAGAKAFEIIYNPTPEQLNEVITATKQFAMFRSFSAMHVPSSNLLGWQIGFETQL